MQAPHYEEAFQFQDQKYLPQAGGPTTFSGSAHASSAHRPSSRFDNGTSSPHHFQPMMRTSNRSMGTAIPFTPSHLVSQQHQQLLFRSGQAQTAMGSMGSSVVGIRRDHCYDALAANTSLMLQRACSEPAHFDHRLDHLSDELEDFDPLPLNLGTFNCTETSQQDVRDPFDRATSPPSQPPSTLQRSSSLQEPSSVACTVQRKDENQTGSEMPQPSILHTPSLLHNSCKLYPDTLFIVESALRMDPNSIRCKVIATSGAALMDSSSESAKESPGASFRSLKKGGRNADGSPTLYKKRKVVDAFGYPINIALKHKASNDVIDLLLREGPDVLSMPDGADDSSTLAIAIELGKEHDVLRRIMKSNHQAVLTRDKYDNLPLHNLLRTRTSPLIESVRMVYRANPDALRSVNFHGHTPLDLAVRNESCSEEVLNYLHTVEFKDQEDRATHLDDLVD